MVRFIAAVVFSLLVSGVAAAQGSGVNWSGYYVGANLGLARLSGDFKTTTCSGSSSACYFGASGSGTEIAPGVIAAGSGRDSDNALTGGIQGGGNWQFGSIVLGAEADFNYLKAKASVSGRTVYPSPASRQGANIANSVEADYLATLRGRLGYASDRVLLYVTGGLALANLSSSHDLGEFGFGTSAPCAGTSANNNYCARATGSVRAGWVIGGGGEYAIDKNWSSKGEYLYVDFASVAGSAPLINGNGSGVVTTGGAAQSVGFSSDAQFHIGRLGLNYRF